MAVLSIIPSNLTINTNNSISPEEKAFLDLLAQIFVQDLIKKYRQSINSLKQDNE